ncbi:MAG: aminotransferase class I/II-fold pyridoxal phosphate-dependent enzyme [Bacteroidales bacterium]|jgi:methionine-gamma-lyase|nr:aminotransferase class I/II-fold pyridoxal phosphate-dependent enzyme [Bacteroidales bacterium]MCK9448515.1 aminotransferase class I/II-fold pyridoxal phosphate-dependent enzyme [Bacteroidales bacterium]MDD3701567.1 aminotransferase class I/II-fold pyridoxal phosphate-dependent enzyme [Bacteroidales bacterium]MDY0370557.1 aminotransferase class I/II-fold pyridoxal phosphate-dependent enzyme [Bacteroidales bacterium]
MKQKNLGFNSKAVHAGTMDDVRNSAISPIYQTSTFRFDSADHGAKCFAGEDTGYIYTRLGNPTIKELEDAVAILENGYGGIAVSSGMAAVNTVYMTYLGQGKHVVAHNSLYGPSRGVLETIYPRFGITASFVDATDPQNVADAIQPDTALIYLETPANPTIGITDLEAVVRIARQHQIPVCVDNTFCSPYLQKPLELGVDIVLHSMTKFINGHADIVAGMIVTKTKEEYQKLRPVMVNMGFNMDPHQAWLTRRGLKTLGIRIEKAQENAIQVAQYLEQHPKVEWVLYPGLSSHPQYELGKRQMKGPGSMLSFSLKGGFEAGKRMMDHVQLALLAVSLGGIETLIQHPASMTHSKLSKEAKETAGITEGLVRLSVGIEEVEDIIKDLEQALLKV